MVGEFRARMVGRFAILMTIYDGEKADKLLKQVGADVALDWVRDRYPHLALGFRQFEPYGSHFAVIEFEDDQQATDFKLRWV